MLISSVERAADRRQGEMYMFMRKIRYLQGGKVPDSATTGVCSFAILES